MANRERGEVDLAIDGKTYTMVLTTNALCELEDLMSTPLRPVTYADVLMASKKGSTRAMRAVFWASLRQHHRTITLEDAGQLMDLADASGKTFAEKLAALAFAAMPADDDVKALGLKAGKENPPKAQRGPRAGTGTRSTSKHVTSA